MSARGARRSLPRTLVLLLLFVGVSAALLAALPTSAAPTLIVFSPSGSPYYTASSAFGLRASVDPANASVTLNGAPVAANATGVIDEVLALSEGSNNFTLVATDAMNETANRTFEVILDTVPPAIALDSPRDESTLTNRSVFAVRGSLSEPATLWLNGLLLPLGPSDNFSYEFALADGLNVLRLVAADLADNRAVVVRTVTFDRYAPFLQVDAPVNGLLTNQTTLTVLGRTEPDATVTVNGFNASVNPLNGTFSVSVPLQAIYDQTEDLVVVRAGDAAGNIRFENRTVIVDILAPSFTFNITAEIQAAIAIKRPLIRTSLDINGTLDDPDSVLTVQGHVVPLAGVSFSTSVPLAEGLNNVTLTARDLAGNTRVVVLQVIRDTIAPLLHLAEPNATDTVTDQPVLRIAADTEDPAAVGVVVFTDARGLLQLDEAPTTYNASSGRYEFSYTLVLVTDGEPHAVAVRATDWAGNFREVSFTYTSKFGQPFLAFSGFEDRVSALDVWVNGTTEAGITSVTVNGAPYPVHNGTFSVRVRLPPASGTYPITIRVRDAAGTERVETLTATLSFSPPRFPASASLTVDGAPSQNVPSGKPTQLSLDLPNLSAFNIDWTVDGAPAGNGTVLSTTFAEGSHTVVAWLSNGATLQPYSFTVVARGAGAGPSAGPLGEVSLPWLLAMVGAVAIGGSVLLIRSRAKR